MDSEFITWMDRYDLENPNELELDQEDESLAILRKKGLQHEHAYLASLKAANKDVYEVPGEDAEFCTLNAMKDGRDIIYQAALRHQQFRGRADFLIKRPGLLKESFLLQQQNFDAKQRPMPNGLDGHGRWSEVAKQMLEDHDHLGRVANIRKTQIRKLEKSGITKLSQLADAACP